MERWARLADKENLDYWEMLETQENVGFKENK